MIMQTKEFLFIIQLAIITMNVIIALGVSRDARRIKSTSGKELKILDPMGWTLISCIGGLPAFAIYSVLHHVEFTRGYSTSQADKI
jgi:hypothetical protein